jgi:uncharacterized protein (DUF934 family)
MLFIPTHDDPWHRVGGEDGPVPHPQAGAHRLLTLEQWHAVRETWPAELPVGVLLPNTADVEALAADLPRLALVALEFPKWVDGRAYSQAHLLRARLGYRGQLRATGEVLVDMLPLLQRTGFDAVQLRPDQKESSALSALGLVSDHYQGDVHQPRPLFARVAA